MIRSESRLSAIIISTRSEIRDMDDTKYEILSALRLGSVPSNGLSYLAVGREAEILELETQLDFVGKHKSAIKFVSGDYGTGKSFLCALIRERAYEKGFISSTVVVSPESPIAKLDIIMGKTFDGLRLPEKRGACGLSDLLERWLLRLLKRLAAIEGLSLSDPGAQSRLNSLMVSKIDENMSAARGMDASFVNAVKAYFISKMQHDPGLANDALGWLKGNSNLSSRKRNQIGVRGAISPTVALSYLKSLLIMIDECGYKGLVWVIDELETVQRIPNSRYRENSYETLRVLVDQVAENALPGLQLIITGTPSLFEDARYGIPSYKALKDRINQLSLPNGSHSLKQPIIELHGFDIAILTQVAGRVRDIHGSAFNWSANTRLDDSKIAQLAEVAATAFGGHVERTPRVFLREIVHLCDILHEHPALNVEEFFKNDVALSERLLKSASAIAGSRSPV